MTLTRTHWFVATLSALLRDARDRYDMAHERRALGHASLRELEDMGISRDAARSEARRPFWHGSRCA